jgi:hypothetical protein
MAAAAARSTLTAITAILVVSALALASWPAQAAQPAAIKLINKPVTGLQYGVSCLSRHLCVLIGYNSSGVGDVVLVRNGNPGPVTAVRHTENLESVSCPNASGCVALADPAGGAGVGIVKINSVGVATSLKVMSITAGDQLFAISCTKLTSCVVAGANDFTTPWKIVVGTWNGTKFSLHSVSSPKGTSDTTVGGLSCAGGTCDVVGSSDKGVTTIGVSVTFSGGKFGKLHTATNDALTGVSCISKSRCYADGDASFKAGVVVTISNGAIGAPQNVKTDLNGIACSGNSCTAVGKEFPPQPSSDTYWGTLVSVASGKVTGTQFDSASAGFDDIVRIGPFLAAAGSSQGGPGKPPSEVTTG